MSWFSKIAKKIIGDTNYRHLKKNVGKVLESSGVPIVSGIGSLWRTQAEAKIYGTKDMYAPVGPAIDTKNVAERVQGSGPPPTGQYSRTGSYAGGPFTPPLIVIQERPEDQKRVAGPPVVIEKSAEASNQTFMLVFAGILAFSLLLGAMKK